MTAQTSVNLVCVLGQGIRGLHPYTSPFSILQLQLPLSVLWLLIPWTSLGKFCFLSPVSSQTPHHFLEVPRNQTHSLPTVSATGAERALLPSLGQGCGTGMQVHVGRASLRKIVSVHTSACTRSTIARAKLSFSSLACVWLRVAW